MKKENWKEIIGPCFDEMVKSFLSEIRAARNLPNEGLFQMPEEINKTVLSNNNLDSSFTINEEEFINHLKEIDSDKTNLIVKVVEKIGNDSDSTQALLDIANTLPEESKKFYIREFNSISDESELINNNLKGKKKKKPLIKIQNMSLI